MLVLFFGTAAMGQTNLLISEYGEGDDNNKYLEIYNGTGDVVDLTQFAFPNVANEPTTPGEYEYWNTFPDGATVASGEVYVIAHPEANADILAEADHTFTYLSNGNDGYCIAEGTEGSYTIVDCMRLEWQPRKWLGCGRCYRSHQGPYPDEKTRRYCG